MIRNKSNWLCLIIILSCIQINAHARAIPDSKRQLIDIIIQQTGTEKALTLMTNQLSGEILSLLKQKNVNIDQNLIMLVQTEAKTVIYEDFVLSNKFNDIFYELYDEYFSEPQLKDIVTFYDSSAGKKLLSAMPDIGRRSLSMAQEHSKGIGSKVQQRLMKRFDEVEKKIDETEQKQDENK